MYSRKVTRHVQEGGTCKKYRPPTTINKLELPPTWPRQESNARTAGTVCTAVFVAAQQPQQKSQVCVLLCSNKKPMNSSSSRLPLTTAVFLTKVLVVFASVSRVAGAARAGTGRIRRRSHSKAGRKSTTIPRNSAVSQSLSCRTKSDIISFRYRTIFLETSAKCEVSIIRVPQSVPLLLYRLSSTTSPRTTKRAEMPGLVMSSYDIKSALAGYLYTYGTAVFST